MTGNHVIFLGKALFILLVNIMAADKLRGQGITKNRIISISLNVPIHVLGGNNTERYCAFLTINQILSLWCIG